MDQKDLLAFELDTKRAVPGFRLDWKDTSWLQQFIGILLKPFCPSFMTNFITTLYPVVYFPSEGFYLGNPTGSFVVLAHERVHLLDAKSNYLWFTLSYILPQVLAIPLLLGAVVAAFFTWWVALPLLVLGLLSLLPLPSPWRVYWEKRGYAMSIAAAFWVTGGIPESMLANIKTQFITLNYYKMSWSEGDIDNWIETTCQSVRDGTIELDPIYGDVLRFVVSHGIEVGPK